MVVVGSETVLALAFRYSRPATAVGYLLFGQGPDLFLTHETAEASDFGQIVAVQGPRPLAGQAVHLTVPGREDRVDGRLTPGEQVRANATSPPSTLDLQVLAEVYLDTA